MLQTEYRKAQLKRIAAEKRKHPYVKNAKKKIEENNRMGKTIELFRKLEIPRDYFSLN